MRGIRTYFRRWIESKTGFRQAYQCLYPLLGGLYFVEHITSSGFSFPWDDCSFYDRFVDSCITQDGDYGLFESQTLIDNDQHVSDDWNSIVLADISEVARHRKLTTRVDRKSITSAQVKACRIVFFHNFDGAFWQFFTNDSEVTDRMLSYHAASDDLDLRFVEYEKDYPDPGEYRDDYPPVVS